MPLTTKYFTRTRDFKAGTQTSQCHTGSDAVETDFVEIGGEILVNEKVKGWRKKIRMGLQATGAYSGTELACEFSPGHVSSRKWCNHVLSKAYSTETVDGNLHRVTGSFLPPSAPSQSLPATTNAQAMAKFVAEARREQSSFRGSNFIAEIADTLRGIRNPAMGIRRLIDSYHQRARRNVRRAMRRDPMNTRVRDLSPGQAAAGSRALSETWLEYQFGILPLINDIRSASRALDRLPFRQPSVRIDASQSNETVPTITLVDNTVGQNVSHIVEVHTSSIFHVRFYGTVKLQMGSFGSVAQESGFQVRDFLPALWEWIPYSFLVDYFTNIGDIIECATFNHSDIGWAARTWRNTAVRDCSRMTLRPQNNFSWPTSNAIEMMSQTRSSLIWRRKFFSRAAYSGSLVPRLLVEVPGFRNTKRWLNIAALLRLRGMRR